MTSKQRAYLISLASKEPTILYVGKGSLTPELSRNVDEALTARELIKIGLQQNCPDDPDTLARTIAERAQAHLVQRVGKKIVLYRENKERKKRIELPN